MKKLVASLAVRVPVVVACETIRVLRVLHFLPLSTILRLTLSSR